MKHKHNDKHYVNIKTVRYMDWLFWLSFKAVLDSSFMGMNIVNKGAIIDKARMYNIYRSQTKFGAR